MISFKDELDIFQNEKFRASSLVFEVWNKIESDLLYSIGLSEHVYITIYFDNDVIFFTATSLGNVISTKNYKFNFTHTLTLLTEISVTFNAVFKDSVLHEIFYDKKAFYYDHSNKEDDGEVDIQCEIQSNLLFFEDIKLEIIGSISKELQYAVNRNVLEREISKNIDIEIDTNFEIVKTIAKIKNLSLEESTKLAHDMKLFDIYIHKRIIDVIERIKNDKQ